MEALEKSGFEHIGNIFFKMLVRDKTIYILNNKDFMVAKFSRNDLRRAECVFKTKKGQAPKEMIAPATLFLYDEQTIAVSDIARNSVFFFDLDLNYIKETRINDRIGRMVRVGNSFASQLRSKEDDAVAIIDNDFKIVRTIIKANKTLPFEGFFPPFLNMVYYPGNNLIAHSYWCLPFKECFVNIHDLEGNMKVKLSWKHPYTLPTAKTFKNGQKLYSCDYVGIYGSYYVVKCKFIKVVFGSKSHDLLIFNREGNLEFKDDFPYDILDTTGSLNESHIYFMDDEEGISYIDVEELLKRSL
jgi:hypothetical protein